MLPQGVFGDINLLVLFVICSSVAVDCGNVKGLLELFGSVCVMLSYVSLVLVNGFSGTQIRSRGTSTSTSAPVGSLFASRA